MEKKQSVHSGKVYKAAKAREAKKKKDSDHDKYFAFYDDIKSRTNGPIDW